MDAELRRVYVDANHDGRVFKSGEPDERQVARVQSTHCGNEADSAVVEKLFATPLPERWDLPEDFDGCVGNG